MNYDVTKADARRHARAYEGMPAASLAGLASEYVTDALVARTGTQALHLMVAGSEFAVMAVEAAERELARQEAGR